MQNTGPKGCPIAVSFSVTAQHSTAGNGRHKGKHNHTLWNSSSKTKSFFNQSLAENQLIVCNINVKKLTTNTKAKAVLFSTGRLYLSSQRQCVCGSEQGSRVTVRNWNRSTSAAPTRLRQHWLCTGFGTRTGSANQSIPQYRYYLFYEHYFQFYSQTLVLYIFFLNTYSSCLFAHINELVTFLKPRLNRIVSVKIINMLDLFKFKVTHKPCLLSHGCEVAL